MSETLPRRPYLMTDWPQSDGRTFLAHAFSFFCGIEWGMSFEEIDAAFDPHSACDGRIRQQIMGAVQNFGRVFQQGRITTYARPIGGGTPKPLSKEMWELDDFGWRFGASAIDPSDPFNPDAAPTHWIFVNTDQFDEILGLVQGDPPAQAKDWESSSADARPPQIPETPRPLATEDRYLRKAEVLKLVPFSRSTLDDRVRRGLFPKSQNLGGGIVAWWLPDILEWMRDKGGRP
jgi:prophage regulatory protein